MNLFETTIRVLGGLLSTYHLTNDNMYLSKATDLADRLMGAFKTVSGIPYSDINLLEARGHSPKWSPDSSTSEVTTIQLEFRDLSRCTNDEKYEKAVDDISLKIHNLDRPHGLVIYFCYILVSSLQFNGSIIWYKVFLSLLCNWLLIFLNYP